MPSTIKVAGKPESFQFHPIRDKKDHAEALGVITEWQLRHAELPKGREADRLAEQIYVLALVIEDYERKHFLLDADVTQADILRFLMDQHGLAQSDFENEIGPQPNVSDILKGKRKLTVDHIRKLAKRFNLSPELFVMAA